MNNLMLQRRPIIRVLSVAWLAGGLLACQGDAEPTIDTAAEADVIMELEREWSRRFGRRGNLPVCRQKARCC